MKQLILIATLLITQGAMAETCHNSYGEQLNVEYIGLGIQAQLISGNTVTELQSEYRTRYIQKLTDVDGNFADLIIEWHPRCLRCDPPWENRTLTAQLTYLGKTHRFVCPDSL